MYKRCLYKKNRQHNDKLYWRCQDRKCQARLTTSLPPALSLLRESGTHTCGLIPVPTIDPRDAASVGAATSTKHFVPPTMNHHTVPPTTNIHHFIPPAMNHHTFSPTTNIHHSGTPTQVSPPKKRSKVELRPKVNIFTNRAGNTAMIIEGQRFRPKYKRKDGLSVWVCMKKSCSAKAETNSAHELVKLGLHNHDVILDGTVNLVPNTEFETMATDNSPAPSPPTDTVDFITTSKGKPAVIYESFLFHHHKTYESYTLWRCRLCRNFIKTRDDTLLSSPKPHNHESMEAGKIKFLKIKEKLRVASATLPDEKPAHLIANCLVEGNDLQDKDVINLRRTVRRNRRRLYKRIPPTKQATLSELATIADDDNGLVRKVDSDIVFVARKQDLQLLNTDNLTLFCDGTFKYSPDNFKQMLSFFIHHNGFYIPICHFLLQNKLYTSYRKAVAMLKIECHKLGFNLVTKTKQVMMDFEESLIKAVRKELSQSQVQGCLFHLGQSWWRKIKELGLSSAYRDLKSREGRWLRRCFGLPLLPPELVDPVFKNSILRGSCSGKMRDFQKYIYSTYIKQDSQFPPTRWAGLQTQGKKTNNGAEAFHRHFGDLFGYTRAKPDIWHFLRNMDRFNKLKDTKLRSNKPEKPVVDFWSPFIYMYRSKRLSSLKLLDSLSKKNQPKTKV